MRAKLSRARWAPFLAAIGPGLIAAAADDDAGGITTYSLVGAQTGYSLLWALVIITICLAITQEMGARMGVVTGKGFGDLIRERFGARWAALAIIAMLIANLANTVAELAGVASALLIFGISPLLGVPLAAILVALLVMRLDYIRVQNVFLLSAFLYLAYVVSGQVTHPNWSAALVGTFRPTFSLRTDFLMIFAGLVGTTITPWGQFFIQSYVVDKRLKTHELPYARTDVYVGAFFTDFVAFFIIIACAATIWTHGLHISDAADAAKALEPLAGRFASSLFAFGLINASMLGAAVLPLTSAYATCETFGWESGINKRWRDAPVFFGLFTFFLATSALVVLLPRMPLLQIMFLSQVLNTLVLPILFVFMLKLTNDRSVMGKYTNSRIFNTLAFLTTVAMIALSVLLVVLPLLHIST